jgi:hypothetical protein
MRASSIKRDIQRVREKYLEMKNMIAKPNNSKKKRVER